ncbi:DsrE family protein [Bradyrhizobium jicamae]|uniref:DsrE family protein n=1 Tax=Bradyrhizobium jicamae TaxID=280332 RepID=A0ABS5FL73_9BRAD|nr:DsrE family protein [Bradyrhizobium jicamae]MBR0797116.1 DsrE family protein [Bradyrhizobium jicamae]
MSTFRHTVRAIALGAVTLLFAASLAQAGRYWVPTASDDAMGQPRMAATTHKATTYRKTTYRNKEHPPLSANARLEPETKTHRLILQVNTNDPAAMNLALNNASNVAQYYKDLGEKVKIEVITFGPGLHMLREDTSPVKSRIEEMALSTPEVSFKACGNTQEKMHNAEKKDIPIVPQAEVVKSGVVRVMELQEKGWSYVKP